MIHRITNFVRNPIRANRRKWLRNVAWLALFSYFTIGCIAFVPEWHDAICHHCHASDGHCDGDSRESGHSPLRDGSCLFSHMAQGHFLHAVPVVFGIQEVQRYETIHWVCPESIRLSHSPYCWPPIAAPPIDRTGVGDEIDLVFV